MTFQFFMEHFASAFFEGAFLYSVLAVPFFLLFWVILKKKVKPIRIQEVERATNHHFRHDILHSLNNFAIFAILDIFLVYLQSQDYTFLYYDVSKYGRIGQCITPNFTSFFTGYTTQVQTLRP